MAIRPDVIRRVISVAEAQTRELRMPVTQIPMIGRNEFGPVFGDPVELVGDQSALVEQIGEGVPTASGQEQVTRSKLTFFFPLVVTDRDRFRIGDSLDEWPVMKVQSLLDPDGLPYMVEVWLGEQRTGA